MTETDWIGFIGVTLLLVAFLLNLIGVWKKENFSYLLMNILGAGTACFASILLKYLPFVILEGCWMVVSLISLISHVKTYKRQES
jgi:uncharacterized protein with PQ loop repeat